MATQPREDLKTERLESTSEGGKESSKEGASEGKMRGRSNALHVAYQSEKLQRLSVTVATGKKKKTKVNGCLRSIDAGGAAAIRTGRIGVIVGGGKRRITERGNSKTK